MNGASGLPPEPPGTRSSRSRRLLAIDGSGMARGYVEPPLAHLIAVYVTPDWRRQGVGEAHSRAVVDWARGRGAAAVVLSVSDWNEGARRVYESIGFVPTGVLHSLPWYASITESEMRLELGP
jgi:GNAT superfamily N-acetyltransferase